MTLAGTSEFDSISDWLAYWLAEPRLPEPEQSVLEGYYYSYFGYFGPYIRSHYGSQITEAQRFIAERPGCRVLEIGCGCGTESLWMGLLGASVTGIDIQEERLKVANARLEHLFAAKGPNPDVRFEMMSAFDALKLGHFDLIWMEQAFHHVEPREQFVELLTDLLEPGGAVILSESNGWNPIIQLALFKKRGFKTVKTYTDASGALHEYGDERILTGAGLEKALKRGGLTPEAPRYFRIFPNRPWAERFQSTESNVPKWFRPAFTHFNLVARKPTC